MPTKARQNILKTFEIDYASDLDNYRYIGKFTTKKMSLRDLAALGVRKSRLNGGMYYDAQSPGQGVSQSTDEFNYMLAHLDICLVDVPEWWDLDNITDPGLLGEVYGEVMKFENSFPGLNGESSDGMGEVSTNSEGSGEGQETQPDSVRAVGPVVDEKVQSSLEP